MPENARAAGVVLGNAFGSVDGTAAFMRRLRDKGARLASPADFPGLVPSSRFAMPERVSIVLPAEPRSKAMIALGIALVALVVMSTTFIVQLGTRDDVTTSQVR